MTRTPRASRALLVAVLAPTLLLAGCGGDTKEEPKAKPSTDLPSGNVEVPDDVTLTDPGTTLEFGEEATVAYEPNTQRSSVLDLRVDSVQRGRISDFSSYRMDATTKSSRPYYVRVSVRNVGEGDLGGAAVPLFAVNDDDALVQPSSFNNTFEKCPSKPLPDSFAADDSFRGCLTYLIPDGGTLTAMSFRPLQAFEPITWEGEIEPPAGSKKAKKQADKKGKKKAGAKQGTP